MWLVWVGFKANGIVALVKLGVRFRVTMNTTIAEFTVFQRLVS